MAPPAAPVPTLLLLLLVAVVLAVAWAPAAEDTAFPAAVQLLWQLVWAPAADDVPPCAVRLRLRSLSRWRLLEPTE